MDFSARDKFDDEQKGNGYMATESSSTKEDFELYYEKDLGVR